MYTVCYTQLPESDRLYLATIVHKFYEKDDNAVHLRGEFLRHGYTVADAQAAYNSRECAVHSTKRRYRVSKYTNTRTAEFNKLRVRVKVMRRVSRRICRIHFQSQLPDNHVWVQTAEARRAERERIQRRAAKAAERMLEKEKLTKKERKAAVLLARDKRDPAFQSGIGVGAAVGATASAMGLLILRGLSKHIKKKTDEVTNYIEEIKRFVANASSTFKKYLGAASWFVPLVMLLWYFLKKTKHQNMLVQIPICAYVARVVGPKMWALISDFFPGGGGTAQVGSQSARASVQAEFQSGAMHGAAELLTVLTTFSIFKKRLGPREVTEFAKRISVFDRVKQGYESFIDWAMRGFQSIVNGVRTMFGKERVALFNDSRKPALDWMREVDKAYAQHNTATAPNTTEELNKLVKLVVDGNAFKDLYRGTPMSRQVDDSLARVVCLLQPHLGALNARNNFRQEPVSVMLVGAPGVGKTLISMAACITIMTKSGLLPEVSFEKAAENIWQKGCSEFWNSYSNQMCVIMDDAFQQRVDKTNQDNEFMNIIRMVSSWSMPLNMADLASKGKIFFGSKLVFGTTNLASIASEARVVLQEPEAVARRINYGYRLHLLPKYMNSRGHLDMGLYESEQLYAAAHGTDVGRFPWHMWEVSKHDFMSGITDPVRRPMLDLIMDIADELRSRGSNFTASETCMRSYVEGLASSVQQPPVPLSPTSWVQSAAPQPSSATLDVEPQGGLRLWRGLHKEIPRPGQARAAFLEDFEDFMSTAEDAQAWWMGWLRGAGLVAVAGVGIYAGFKFVSCALKGIWVALNSLFNSRSNVVTPTEQSNRPVGVKLSPRERKAILAQSANDAVQNNIYANSYKFYSFTDGTMLGIIGQVQFLRADIAVMPAHFTREIAAAIADGRFNSTTMLTLRSAVNYQHAVHISPAKFLSLPRVLCKERDQEFVKFQDVRAHRDIVANFIKEIDVKYLGNQTATLDICNIDADTGTVSRRTWVAHRVSVGKNLVVAGENVSRFVQYGAGTVPGNCGAPLCLNDNSRFSGRTAIGVHIAGARQCALGFATIVTQEDIRVAIEKLGGAVEDKFEQDLCDRGISFQSGDELPFATAGSFLPLGTVSIPVNLCPKSKYYQVERMFGRFGECLDRPAALSPVMRDGELVYPMVNAMAPYASPLMLYEQEWLPQAVYLAFTKVAIATEGSSRAIYDFQEAVQGIAQAKFRAVPKGTSAGYPYVLEHKDGKTAFFGRDGVNQIDTPLALELKERVDYIIESAYDGVRLAHVFQDFLKDELRSPAKVDAVATRLISAAPLDYTVAVRQYFGAFSVALMTNTIKTGMAPGICAYSDWNELAIHLQAKGPDVFDGDLKHFDSGEQPTILRLLLDGINKWYDDGPENARVREVLWLDLMHSRHIGGLGKDQRYIYQWNKSLPSGHPLTTIVNSLYCLVLLIGSYISCTKDLTGFWDQVSPITYGDDNVSNVSRAMSDLYNQVSVSQAMLREFGMVYTPGRKDGLWKPISTLCEVTFLKRGFRIDGGRWVAPLELGSFLHTSYWCKRPLEEEEHIKVMLELALEELSMHPEYEWGKYSALIISAMEEVGHRPRVLPEKKEYLRLVQTRTDNYY